LQDGGADGTGGRTAPGTAGGVRQPLAYASAGQGFQAVGHDHHSEQESANTADCLY
jgi:hypothetical protein